MRAVTFIARTHLSSMLRQKETLLWTFVMPLIFFYFIGTVTGGFGGASSEERPDALSFESEGELGFLGPALRTRLEAQNFALVPPSPESDQLPARRLILPPVPTGYANLGAAVLDGQPAKLEFRRRGEDAGAQFDQVRVGRAVYGLLADMLVASQEGPLDPESIAAVAQEPRPLSLRVERAGQRIEIPNGYEQTIPGTSVMFTMMILLTGGAILLVIERQQGLLRRLASTPITRGQLVAGKWIGLLALACVQLSFALLAGWLFFDMDWGPHLGTVCLLLVSWAAFNASLAILLASIARSEAQMSAIGVLASMVLAALGGCWWPIEITPAWMQSLARCLPTGWAMDAMHHLVSFGDGPVTILPQLTAILSSALLLAMLAVRHFRYQ